MMVVYDENKSDKFTNSFISHGGSAVFIGSKRTCKVNFYEAPDPNSLCTHLPGFSFISYYVEKCKLNTEIA